MLLLPPRGVGSNQDDTSQALCFKYPCRLWNTAYTHLLGKDSVRRIPSQPIGPIAQWSEQATHNRLVGGSNPSGPTILSCAFNDFVSKDYTPTDCLDLCSDCLSVGCVLGKQVPGLRTGASGNEIRQHPRLKHPKHSCPSPIKRNRRMLRQLRQAVWKLRKSSSAILVIKARLKIRGRLSLNRMSESVASSRLNNKKLSRPGRGN
jgi:hypothetical protein